MIYVSVLSERAYSELLEAWQWYEERQEGVGDRFKEYVFSSLNQLEKNPLIGIRRKRSFRELTVKVFPYLIIYRIEHKTRQIYVDSIFHTSRNPKEKYQK